MSDLPASDQIPAEAAPVVRAAPPARYATFTRRFRALVIDNLCISGIGLALFFAADALSDVPGVTRVMLLLVVAEVLLYEPLLVSRRGATIGHAYARLRVMDARTGGRPSFGRAFLRFVIKVVLGPLSFFTMELTRRHQAVHDMVAHTTVQVVESADVVDYRVERVDEPDVVLPSRLRRLTVIVLYLVAVFLVYVVSLTFADTTGCLRDRGGCSAGTQALIQVIAWGWLALSATVIVAGWKGVLLGARRTRRIADDVAVA